VQRIPAEARQEVEEEPELVAEAERATLLEREAGRVPFARLVDILEKMDGMKKRRKGGKARYFLNHPLMRGLIDNVSLQRKLTDCSPPPIAPATSLCCPLAGMAGKLDPPHPQTPGAEAGEKHPEALQRRAQDAWRVGANGGLTSWAVTSPV
jgi:hypothetical protein